MIVTGEEKARGLADGDGIVRLLAMGFARVGKARMPKAPVPAAEMALADAGIPISGVDVIKTHNSVRRQRRLLRQADGGADQGHEQLRVKPHLRPPSGTDRGAPDLGDDRGAQDEGRRDRPLHRLRRRRPGAALVVRVED